MDQPICLRFAPSPTGYLHIGGARTALFNWLYAKRQKGKFYLRIEDTDRERSQPEYETEILNGLQWLGLRWDGEIVRQSERLGYYNKIIETLIRTDKAYYVDDQRQAVKLKRIEKEVIFFDLIRGQVKLDSRLFEDIVLRKSDGFPTYHLACVADDADMAITHVVRGEDHLTNTAKQILIFEALEWNVPKYAHLPLILGSDGSPLSKRHGAVAVSEYQKEGFLPEGFLNYLALLGWSPKKNKEIISKDQMTEAFSLKQVNKTSARFDLEKARWVNSEHLKNLQKTTFVEQAKVFLSQAEKKVPFEGGDLDYLISLYQNRIKIFSDFYREADYFFTVEVAFDKEAEEKYYTSETAGYLKAVLESIEGESGWAHTVLEKKVRDVAVQLNVKAAELIHPIRLAITGHAVSPGVFEVMQALGKTQTIRRLQKAIEHLKKAHEGK